MNRVFIVHVQRLVGMVVVWIVLGMHHLVLPRIHHVRNTDAANHRERLPNEGSQSDEYAQLAGHLLIVRSR